MRNFSSSVLMPAFALAALGFGLLAAFGEDFKLPPEEVRLKPAPGADVVKGNCLLCHSADYITTQPPLTRAQWTATVEKMRAKYGAPVSTNAVPGLLDYLTGQYGKPAPAAKP